MSELGAAVSDQSALLCLQASLLQDAKEGFVGAYDTAAGAAASAADKVKDTAASLTGSGQQQQQPSADQHPGSASAAGREAAGGGSGGVGGGSGSAGGSNTDTGSTGGGMFASLKQGWEDLKHGGAPAPRAVSHAVSVSGSFPPSEAVVKRCSCITPDPWNLIDTVSIHVFMVA